MSLSKGRIHVSTGQLERVLDEPFLLHLHQDPLTTDGTDVVAQASARHASPVVVLKTHV